jgi:HTH-type transcriptional regulator/antitoxin HipB
VKELETPFSLFVGERRHWPKSGRAATFFFLSSFGNICISSQMNIVSVKDLAVCIKQARNDRGWTQAQLAEQAGVSRDWVIGLEAGKASVELGLVLRTMKALGLPLSISPQPNANESSGGINLDEILKQPSRDVPWP